MTRRGRILLAAGLVLAAALAAAGGLAARLVQGPLALPGLAPWVAARLSDHDRGFVVSIENIVLSYFNDPIDGHGRIGVLAQDAAVRDPSGALLAAVPEVGLGLSAQALLRGELRPTRLELVRPQLTVLRQPDGGFGFAIARPVPAPETEAAPAPRADADTAATPVAAGLLEALLRKPDPQPLLGLLRRVAVRDGDLTISDPGRGLRWRANPANVQLDRGGAGIEGRMRLTLDLGPGDLGPGAERPPPLTANLSYDAASRRSALSVTFSRVTPAALAGLSGALAPLAALRLPVDGRVDTVLGPDFGLIRADFLLRGGAGAVTAPPSAQLPAGLTLALTGAEAAGDYAADAGRLTVTRLGATLDDGTTVTANGTAELGAEPLRLRGRAQARFRDFRPDRLAGLSPQLAALAGLRVPLSGEALIEQQDGPPRLRTTLALGNGELALPDVFSQPLPLRGGGIDAAVDLKTGDGALQLTALDLGGPRLSANVNLGGLNSLRDADGGRVAVAGGVALTDLPVTRLGQYWPPAVAAKAREWVLENLVDGRASRLNAQAEASIPLADPAATTVSKASARIEVENATLHYFRPLPPAVGIERAVADFDGKDFVIHTRGGAVSLPNLEPVRAGDGRIDIYNVGSPREDLAADIGLSGPLRTVLSIVDLPPLGYPSKLDIKPDKTAGQVEGRLKVAFPLLDAVKLDDVEVQVSAKAHGAAIEKVVAGRDAADGDLAVELDTHAMTVAGKAKFDGAPITFKWREIFDSTIKGPGTTLEAQGSSDVRHLATFGPDLLTEYGVGPVGVKVRYASGANRAATLNVNLDLAPTRLAAPVLRWRKAAGEPGQARFNLHFKNGKPTHLTDLRLEGGGLSATATIYLSDGGTQASRIEAQQVKAGDTNLAVSAVRGADGGYVVRLTGAALDLRGVLEEEEPDEELRPANRPPPPRPPLTVELQLGRALFGADRGLTNAVGQMARRNGEWTTITLRGRTPPAGDLAIVHEPLRAGGSRLAIDATNAGAALRALDLTERVRGGTLKIRGKSAGVGPKATIDGEVEMLDYTLVDAPTLARILNAMSITGLVEALGGEGINFGSLTGRFRKTDNRLTLKEMRTAGGALGLTVEGEVNLTHDTARLNGTVVPFYAINRIIGQIPLLGDLLSGGPGHGIFAAAWTAEGKLSDPQVSVNPLSILTPGFLRSLLFSGPSDDAGDGAAPAAPPAPAHPSDQHFR